MKSINLGIPIVGTIGIIVALIMPYSSPTPNYPPAPNATQILLRKVETLTPGVNINVYQSKFGASAFINQNGKTKEYVFVNTYFYLDAITDINDKVLMFALTIRDRTFNPIFKSPDYPVNQGFSFQITLGVSKFDDVPGDPEYIVGCLGAHDFSYDETRYLGNPGDYEDFGFGFNWAGYRPKNTDFSAFITDGHSNKRFWGGLHDGYGLISTGYYTDQDIENLKIFRTQTVFNTYAVSAPAVSIMDYARGNLGVNYYQVRVLNP